MKQDVEAWLIYNFSDETRVTATLGLCEEVGEVARAVLKQEQAIRGTWEEWDDEIKKELGDVYLKLIQVAMVCGFDLDEVIAQRWEVLRQRDWVRDPKGHGI